MCGIGAEILELMDNEKNTNCSICNKKLGDKYGHNAQPINDGRCCDDCNTLVIIKRIKEMSNE